MAKSLEEILAEAQARRRSEGMPPVPPPPPGIDPQVWQLAHGIRLDPLLLVAILERVRMATLTSLLATTVLILTCIVQIIATVLK